MNSNRKAFLDTVAFSELGPALLAASDDGYNVIVGSTVSHPIFFKSYADHPHRLVTMMIKGKQISSTAAGRYQLLGKYFDVYKAQLGLPDFGHDSQDKIALQLVRECQALDDVDAGRFTDAMFKCRSRWASLPGAGYDQHENAPEALMAAYVRAGGVLA